ncbi:MAG: trypsin-like serine protease [Alphaproteobacteria bacterium]|nr:trypsin-like serine protease [Alphaproteobacteria bacterium]
MIWLTAALAAPPTAQGETTLAAPPDRAEVFIVNGDDEPGYPSTVSLGVGPIHVCTGSVITPRVVLSAAHCSGEVPLEAVVQFGSVRFGEVAADPEVSIGIESAALHPDYIPLGPGTVGEFDFAVVVLAEPSPVDAVFFRTRPIEPADVGTVLRSVGYGIDETGAGSGIKRSASLTISDFDEMYLISDNADNGGSNICSGDSGGPMYATLPDGRLEQWAIHSWGDVECRITSGSTRTDVGVDWILDQVEAVHGTRDLCMANGRYDDDVCDLYCPLPDPDCLPVVLATGESGGDGPKGCSTLMNRFCAPGIWIALLLLSRRRRV